MKSTEFMERAKQEVANYYNSLFNSDGNVNVLIKPEDVYIVWFNFTLQRMKALLSTTVPDGMYYEITYDPNGNQLYFDAYKKLYNKAIKLDE